MPRKPRPRTRPQTVSRKRPRRRTLLAPAAPASETGGAARPKVVPFAPRRPVVQATATPPQARIYDYGYVLRELRRIAIIGGGAMLLVVILSFVLR